MPLDPIIEKIRKLLRMKRGGTPEEIATALRLAQELAAKHGVDLGSVNPDDDAPKSEQIGHEDPISGARIQCECRYAGLVCVQFFNVEVFSTTLEGHWRQARRVYRYALRFVGTDWDRKVAVYVFFFLAGHFRREWKSRRGRCRSREQFMWGMYLGLCRKLRERQPKPLESAALVHTGRQLARRNYIDRHFGKLDSHSVEPDGDADEAKWRGYLAGQQTEIRPAMEKSKSEQLLLA